MKSPLLRAWALSFVFLILFQVVAPTAAYALTSGPSQPEFTAFEPVGASNNVDLFSGDFTYNIPLFELPGPDGGYPFNLAYHSGISMEQEASWVGLGWSLNPGAINRTVRGIPDDFNGVDQKVERYTSMKKDWTVRGGAGLNGEIFGVSSFFNGGFGYDLAFNNYRGWTGGLNLSVSTGGPLSFSSNLGLDSGTGASFSPGIGLSKEIDGTDRSLRIGANFGSREGLSGLSLSTSAARDREKPSTRKYYSKNASGVGAGFSFNNAGYTPTVTQPYVGFNASGAFEAGVFAGVSLGAKVNLAYSEQALVNNGKWVSAVARGYFHHRAGYDETGVNTLLDFNRENELAARQSTPNLALANATPDVFSLTGQGTGGQYLPMRSAPVLVTDARSTSRVIGGGAGVQIDPGGLGLVGGDLSGNWSIAKTKYPDSRLTDAINAAQLPVTPLNRLSEPVYFKAAGELTAGTKSSSELTRYQLSGEDEPVSVRFDGNQSQNLPAPLAIEQGQTSGRVFGTSGSLNDFANYAGIGREKRAQSVLALTTADLYGPGSVFSSTPLLPEFRTRFYDAVNLAIIEPGALTKSVAPTNGRSAVLGDDQRSEDYVVGFIATNQSGLRYNYGIPLWNTFQLEAAYSVPVNATACGNVSVPPITSGDYTDIDVSGTNEQYKNFVKTPPFVHTYLLSNVLGPDYIDLTNNGVTPDDSGYWVNFRYAATSFGRDNLYRWRAPYTGARYIPGLASNPDDDKASFMYGEREQAVLAEASTSTHVARFFSRAGAGSDAGGGGRTDGLGASGIVANDPSTSAADGQGSYRLDSIELYSRTGLDMGEPPIQTVVFEYERTGLTLESPNAPDGKLTLKRVYTTYKRNQRGRTTPYEFDYIATTAAGLDARSGRSAAGYAEYGDYTESGQDRWGGSILRPDDTGDYDYCYSGKDPYAVQSIDRIASMYNGAANVPAGYSVSAETDAAASVWNLNRVTLPSGASLDVHYESDDYAYVQDRQALQMIPIAGIGTPGSASVPTGAQSGEDVRIYFDLERDRRGETLGPTDPRASVVNYLNGLHGVASGQDPIGAQLLFKLESSLGGDGKSYDPVTGYATISGYGVTPDGSQGYVTLNTVALGKAGKQKSYHPFAAAAWQYAKANYPSAVIGNDFMGATRTDVPAMIKRFAGSILDISSIFRNYYVHASKKGLGSSVDLRRSYLRLASPDGSKYGGGTRVAAIVVHDNWDHSTDLPASSPDAAAVPVVYGQVYDYTTLRNGERISSGVATNEPAIGYEECALQYLKSDIVEEAIFRSDQRYTVEFPLNRSVLPGASVGYGEVTVRSLAGAAQQLLSEGQELPSYLQSFSRFDGSDYATSGETQHDFYTARDFPVISRETQIQKSTPAQTVAKTIFFNKTDLSFTASQGYSTVLNDMHGRPRSSTHYGLTPLGRRGVQVNQTTYNYHARPVSHDVAGVASEALEVTSEVPTVEFPEDGKPRIGETQTLGVSEQVTWDARRSELDAGTATLETNGWLVFLFPGAIVSPSGSAEVGNTNTAVSNKVIRKTGILASVDVTDGQSRQRTENLAYDPLTGQAVLTSVSNSYDDPVYALDIPAHPYYEGMGAAYANAGVRCVLDVDPEPLEDCDLFSAKVANVPGSGRSDAASTLFRVGDEVLVSSVATNQITRTIPGLTLTVAEVSDSEISLESSLPPDETFPASATGVLKVAGIITRPGARNHLSTNVGSLQALADPTAAAQESGYADVLSLSANTYSDNWGGMPPAVTVDDNPDPGPKSFCYEEKHEIFTSSNTPQSIDCQNDGYKEIVVAYNLSTSGSSQASFDENRINDDPIVIGEPLINPVVATVDNGAEYAGLAVIRKNIKEGESLYYQVVFSLYDRAGNLCGQYRDDDKDGPPPHEFVKRVPGTSCEDEIELLPDAPPDPNDPPEPDDPETGCDFYADGFLDISGCEIGTTVDCLPFANLLYRFPGAVERQVVIPVGLPYKVDAAPSGTEVFLVVDNSCALACLPRSGAYLLEPIRSGAGDCEGGDARAIQFAGGKPVPFKLADSDESTLIFGDQRPTLATQLSARSFAASSSANAGAPTSRAYGYGAKGIWRPHQSFTYVADRTPLADQPGDEPIAVSGKLEALGVFAEAADSSVANQSVAPFNYLAPFSNIQPGTNEGWRLTSEATAYGDALADGEPTEERSVLGVYSSSQYGFEGYLPEAVAANARQSEMAFAGWEDQGNMVFSEPIGRLDFGTPSQSSDYEWSETYNLVRSASGTGQFVFDYTDRTGRLAPEPYAATVSVRSTSGARAGEKFAVYVHGPAGARLRKCESVHFQRKFSYRFH